jgi:glutaredoxin-like protein
MGLLAEKDREQLIKIFKPIVNNVRIVMFTQEFECEFCKVTRELLEEVSGLSDKIFLDVHDFVKEADLAKNYGVDKIPATLLLGDRDYGIRFYGVPAGYEFSTLIEDVIDVGSREPGLSKEVLDLLFRVDRPVHIQVMISPT